MKTKGAGKEWLGWEVKGKKKKKKKLITTFQVKLVQEATYSPELQLLKSR